VSHSFAIVLIENFHFFEAWGTDNKLILFLVKKVYALKVDDPSFTKIA